MLHAERPRRVKRLFLGASTVAAGLIVAYLVVGYMVAARLSAPVRRPNGSPLTRA